MNRPWLTNIHCSLRAAQLLAGREAGERWVAFGGLWSISKLDLKSGRTTR